MYLTHYQVETHTKREINIDKVPKPPNKGIKSQKHVINVPRVKILYTLSLIPSSFYGLLVLIF